MVISSKFFSEKMIAIEYNIFYKKNIRKHGNKTIFTIFPAKEFYEILYENLYIYFKQDMQVLGEEENAECKKL